jgi:hypothetical protein
VLAIAVTGAIATSYWSCWGMGKDQPDEPYSWLYAPFTNPVDLSSPAYRWATGIAILLNVAMPILVLATIFLPAFDQVRNWRHQVQQHAANDTRSELEKLLDKDYERCA